MRTYHITYYALLREAVGASTETVSSKATTPEQLFEELRRRHGLSMPASSLQVAVNDDITGWNTNLNDGDAIALLPPVAGG